MSDDALAGSSQQSNDRERPAPRWPVSTIVLLALLVVALGLLATDWLHGRIPRDRAYDLLVNELPDDGSQSEAAAGPRKRAISKDLKFWSTDMVHEALKRSPDSTEEKPGAAGGEAVLTETYRFRGAFKSYFLIVQYDKRAHVAHGSQPTTMTGVSRK